MTHHELLRQQYEDALFAFLMDEVAETEGKKAQLESEALRNDPSAQVPEETVRRCRRIIARGFRRQKIATVRRVGRRVLNTAAAVIVICAVGLSTAVAVSPTDWKAVFNLVIQILETDISMGFREDEPSPSTELPELNAGWRPAGFKLLDEGETQFGEWKLYGDTGGVYINVRRLVVEQGALSIDSETPNVEEVVIQGNPGFFVEKEGELRVSFVDEAAGLTLDFLAEGVSRDELLLFAENLIYKN